MHTHTHAYTYTNILQYGNPSTAIHHLQLTFYPDMSQFLASLYMIKQDIFHSSYKPRNQAIQNQSVTFLNKLIWDSFSLSHDINYMYLTNIFWTVFYVIIKSQNQLRKFSLKMLSLQCRQPQKGSLSDEYIEWKYLKYVFTCLKYVFKNLKHQFLFKVFFFFCNFLFIRIFIFFFYRTIKNEKPRTAPGQCNGGYPKKSQTPHPRHHCHPEPAHLWSLCDRSEDVDKISE